MKRITALAVTCLLLATVLACKPYGKKVESSNYEVYYTDAVTEADAKKVADFMEQNIKSEGGDKKSVQLDKSGDTYALRLVVQKDLEKDDNAVARFKSIGQAVSAQVFNGAKVDVHLCDNHFKTLKVVSAT